LNLLSSDRDRLVKHLFGLCVVVTVALTTIVTTTLADGPKAHAARTCADYQNQRDAQLNKDTRDADGDGIYCESLPCPCLKPSSGSKPPPSSSPPAGQGPALFKGRCKRSRLPDYGCTPATVFKNVTVDQICTSGYTKRVRNVSESLKRKVYLSYGIRRHAPYAYEVDHLVSPELGGNNSQRNMWPEKQPGARDKDKIENYLHGQLCAGEISLRSAQSKIKHWTHVQVSRAQSSVAHFIVSARDSRVRSIGGFHPDRNPHLRAAIARFGEPTNRRRLFQGHGCVVEWRSIGLAIQFANDGAAMRAIPTVAWRKAPLSRGRRRVPAGKPGKGFDLDRPSHGLQRFIPVPHGTRGHGGS
jgi:hypothetical protein